MDHAGYLPIANQQRSNGRPDSTIIQTKDIAFQRENN
jgi:hypothetical protein